MSQSIIKKLCPECKNFSLNTVSCYLDTYVVYCFKCHNEFFIDQNKWKIKTRSNNETVYVPYTRVKISKEELKKKLVKNSSEKDKLWHRRHAAKHKKYKLHPYVKTKP